MSKNTSNRKKPSKSPEEKMVDEILIALHREPCEQMFARLEGVKARLAVTSLADVLATTLENVEHKMANGREDDLGLRKHRLLLERAEFYRKTGDKEMLAIVMFALGALPWMEAVSSRHVSAMMARYEKGKRTPARHQPYVDKATEMLRKDSSMSISQCAIAIRKYLTVLHKDDEDEFRVLGMTKVKEIVTRVKAETMST